MVLSTLDVCCPALRSLNLGRFVGGANNVPGSPAGQSGPLTSLIIEQREPPAPGVPTSAMACMFEGLELDHSSSLQSILFKGKSPAASATTNSRRSSPYRAPLKHFKIGVAHTALTSVGIESGWTVAPEAKRGLAYLALEYPHVQVHPKPTAAAGVSQATDAKR